MNRVLLQTKAFVKAVRGLVKKNPETASAFEAALEALGEDAFQPSLKTHKLKGELAGSWACSAGYDLGIVFDLVLHEGAAAILLLSAGTHDEVY